jgi:hypothetical protein
MYVLRVAINKQDKQFCCSKEDRIYVEKHLQETDKELGVLFVVSWFLRRADHSSRGVLLNVLCLSVIVKPR